MGIFLNEDSNLSLPHCSNSVFMTPFGLTSGDKQSGRYRQSSQLATNDRVIYACTYALVYDSHIPCDL